MKKIVYISLPNKNIIKVLKITDNMLFETIQNVKIFGNIQPIYICNKKKILYVGVRKKNKILTFDILKNGTLEEKTNINIDYPSNHIHVNLKHKLLFSSSFHGNCLELYKIDKNYVPYKKIYTFTNIYGCHFSSVTKDNNFLFFTSLKKNKIYYFKMSNLNKINKNFISYIKLGKNFGPRHFVMHNNKEFIYVINELNGIVSTIKIKKKIKVLQNIRLFPNKNKKFWSSEIEITPCNKYLYASDRKINIITSFKIEKKKFNLKFLKYYKTECQPRTFRIDSSGKYLIVAGEKSNNITLYKINKKNGDLTYLIKNFFVGGNPVWINFFDL
ncbi:beta-propeller fold lactonase family protein [Buchnera aphidicola (Pseudoregma panicola)]|uniref:beta-propeller fold lactonase family protein n=1 Tax=Buchnera aphidicola TaxID=9 RepID=UPI0031B6C5B9